MKYKNKKIKKNIFNNKIDKRITIGLIVKDEEKYIGETIDSLIKQTLDKRLFELVIIDGGSKDNTIKIINNLLKPSGISYNIHYEQNDKVHEYDKGHCFSRNLVVKYSSTETEYIAFIDGDCKAEKNWLSNLLSFMEKNKENDLAGCGGNRSVAIDGSSKKELVINYYFTSKIMTMNNPTFIEQKENKNKKEEKIKNKYINSIACYNSIYKKKILQENPFDNRLIISDDIELNYRLRNKGYKFLLVQNPQTKIYHHETDSIISFLKIMYKYGVNIGNVIRKYKSLIKLYVFIGIGYSLYTLFLPLLILFSYYLFNSILDNYISILLPLIPYILVFLISIFVFIENIKKTKSLKSLWVFILVPLHPLFYGLGILSNLFGIKNKVRSEWI